MRAEVPIYRLTAVVFAHGAVGGIFTAARKEKMALFALGWVS